MKNEIEELLETAKRVSVGMIQVAAAKPNDYPLQSNAETFRGAANIMSALSLEVTRVEERTTDLLAKFQRIADLKVRGAAEAINDGDWKAVVEELQAIAQDALVPGSSLSAKPRAPRNIPRRPRA